MERVKAFPLILFLIIFFSFLASFYFLTFLVNNKTGMTIDFFGKKIYFGRKANQTSMPFKKEEWEPSYYFWRPVGSQSKEEPESIIIMAFARFILLSNNKLIFLINNNTEEYTLNKVPKITSVSSDDFLFNIKDTSEINNKMVFLSDYKGDLKHKVVFLEFLYETKSKEEMLKVIEALNKGTFSIKTCSECELKYIVSNEF